MRWSEPIEGTVYEASEEIAIRHCNFLSLVSKLEDTGATLIFSRYSSPMDGQGSLDYRFCRSDFISSLPPRASLSDFLKLSKSNKGFGIEEEVRFTLDGTIETLYHGLIDGAVYSDLEEARQVLISQGYLKEKA
jgi:hypothetical protein